MPKAAKMTAPKIPKVKSSTPTSKGIHSLNAGKTFVTPPVSSNIPSFKHGGDVKQTGIYKLHKGEKVLSKAQLNQKAEKFFSSNYSK